jgi:hypothetical protein
MRRMRFPHYITSREIRQLPGESSGMQVTFGLVGKLASLRKREPFRQFAEPARCDRIAMPKRPVSVALFL